LVFDCICRQEDNPNTDFEEYFVMNDPTGLRLIKNEENLPWSVYVGAAGMPGKQSTAFLSDAPG
jgi:hypothetical protein